MVRLIYSMLMSLDGYIADRSGKFDWAEPDEEVHAFLNQLERGTGTYLYGRRMYEVMPCPPGSQPPGRTSLWQRDGLPPLPSHRQPSRLTGVWSWQSAALPVVRGSRRRRRPRRQAALRRGSIPQHLRPARRWITTAGFGPSSWACVPSWYRASSPGPRPPSRHLEYVSTLLERGARMDPQLSGFALGLLFGAAKLGAIGTVGFAIAWWRTRRKLRHLESVLPDPGVLDERLASLEHNADYIGAKMAELGEAQNQVLRQLGGVPRLADPARLEEEEVQLPSTPH